MTHHLDLTLLNSLVIPDARWRLRDAELVVWPNILPTEHQERARRVRAMLDADPRFQRRGRCWEVLS